MTLNEKIADILRQHKGGEKFFNVLDFIIRGDIDILENFLAFFMNHQGRLLDLSRVGLIVSGKFAEAILTVYGHRLTQNFAEVIVTNGGIRNGEEVNLSIYKDTLSCSKYVFIDDSYYSGRTRDRIEQALKTIDSTAEIVETYVIYDGSLGRAKKVRSMYRYKEPNEQFTTL